MSADRPRAAMPADLPFLASISWFDLAFRELSPRDMLARYEKGIRHRDVTAPLEGEAPVRVELVREGPVALHAAEHEPWTKAPCLARVDCYTEKLLANSDRGADPDELSRDLVDLAALRIAYGPVPPESWSAAEAAY